MKEAAIYAEIGDEARVETAQEYVLAALLKHSAANQRLLVATP